MIFCKNCRFLRCKTHDGEIVRRFNQWVGEVTDDPVYICVAPSNIVPYYTWRTHYGPTLKEEPYLKNHKNDCEDFETAEMAIKGTGNEQTNIDNS